MSLKLIKSGQAKPKGAALFRCARCESTLTVTVKAGGYMENGKRKRATKLEVCAECLVGGRLQQ